MEYLACREDVEALFTKGYSVQLAYEAMQEQGRVTWIIINENYLLS